MDNTIQQTSSNVDANGCPSRGSGNALQNPDSSNSQINAKDVPSSKQVSAGIHSEEKGGNEDGNSGSGKNTSSANAKEGQKPGSSENRVDNSSSNQLPTAIS